MVRCLKLSSFCGYLVITHFKSNILIINRILPLNMILEIKQKHYLLVISEKLSTISIGHFVITAMNSMG